jgi:hypothetical protein
MWSNTILLPFRDLLVNGRITNTGWFYKHDVEYLPVSGPHNGLMSLALPLSTCERRVKTQFFLFTAWTSEVVKSGID